MVFHTGHRLDCDTSVDPIICYCGTSDNCFLEDYIRSYEIDLSGNFARMSALRKFVEKYNLEGDVEDQQEQIDIETGKRINIEDGKGK